MPCGAPASPRASLEAPSAAAPLPARKPAALIRSLGLVDYASAYAAMREFTAARTEHTPDEIWLLQHPPVYTAGIACRKQHLPRAARLEVVRSDRGGQITYHGPGQVVMYTLLDLGRRRLKIRSLVTLLEQAVIDTLAAHGVSAQRRSGAPGVYVADAKIAALGLRVRNGRCYHGLSLNVDMDLAPFADIDPCGYRGLAVTQTRALGIDADAQTLGRELAHAMLAQLERHDGRG